jgi:hypothetical protein
VRVEFTIAFSASINRRNKQTPVCEQRQRGINREREREREGGNVRGKEGM